MKLIHAADIHLGAKMDSAFPKQVAEQRKEELRNTFKRMVDYARTQKVQAIILAGDVFDSDAPFKKDKEFFYSVVKNTPAIDFLYLRGNHDTEISSEEGLPNLKTFGERWRTYRYGSVAVTGAELSPANAPSLYASLSLAAEDVNLVVLHGQAGERSSADTIDLRRLRDKNIDYLALGHIHKPSSGKLDDRGEYAYSGCLEGRGFDECGVHGFLLLDIEDGKVNRTFVPFAERTVTEVAVDVGGVKDAYAAYLRVREQVRFNKKDIYRIDLIGETDTEVEVLSGDVKKYLSGDCFFADVKDKTEKRVDWESFRGDLSLRGEFVRTIYEDPAIPEAEKKALVAIGLKALKGGEINL